jgi:hypothetical protein
MRSSSLGKTATGNEVKVRGRWFRRATFLVPTLRLWTVLILAASCFSWAFLTHIGGFLALRAPASGADVLVIEAGASPGKARYVAGLFRAGGYSRLIPVGMPLGESLLAPGGTEADVWLKRLVRAGVPRAAIEVVRVPSLTRFRTAHKALAVERHLRIRPARAVDLITNAAHARRSHAIYQEALRPTTVGVLPAPEVYDGRQWWRSSAGARAVLGELIALAFFYLDGDEVSRAREQWMKLPEQERQVEGLSLPRRLVPLLPVGESALGE